MGLFDSKEEKELKKRLKLEEKERKRKEFEKIMASNPQVTTRPMQTSVKEKTVCCPNCESTQLSADKKGFSLGKAVAGGVLTLTPIVGVATGMIGKNKIIITCLNCGKQFKPGTR